MTQNRTSPSSTLLSLLSLSLILLSPTLTLTLAAPQNLIPGLILRQTGTSSLGAGGFATRSPTCSPTQVDCGGGIAQEICCPGGTTCFNSDDGVCCPSDVDCTEAAFAAPSCADPSMFLCTDYAPNIPSFMPNHPEYWCCPTGTQCFVTENSGFVCASGGGAGDVPGIVVGSGMAPTQASTATTLPTAGGGPGGATSGGVGATGGGVTVTGTGTGTGTASKAQSTQGGRSTTQNPTPTPSGTGSGSTTGTGKSGAMILTSSWSAMYVALQGVLVWGGMYLI